MDQTVGEPLLLHEYEAVRIARLLAADRYLLHNGTTEPPRVGDVGTIVDMGNPRPEEPWIFVEQFRPDSNTFWLATFLPEELEPLAVS